jgi:hypothetical protein
MTIYIRIEAVNIYNAIYDTDQISIIRGGSLLLKHAIDNIAKEFHSKLDSISTGASVGLFATKCGVQVETAVSEIIDFLNKASYRYFTFVVESFEHNDFVTAREVLLAKCRQAQLQQLTVSPDYSRAVQKDGCCELEGIRPYKKEVKWPGEEKKKLCEFANIKWTYGRRKRSQLYKDELTALGLNESLQPLQELRYTNDLEDLSRSSVHRNMNNKIALIYFDGNRFSKIQTELVRSADDQSAFDKAIKTLRREFLVKLLEAINDNSGWKTEDGKARLETLLWGGDEMLFVVPAWKGFDLLKLFYQCSRNWVIKVNGKTSYPLTHAGGIVFCNHKTPIYKIRNLAQDLADRIKENKDGREKNYFDYLILESIDYPAESLDEFFKLRYGDLAEYRGYLSPDKIFCSLNAEKIKSIISKSQMYAIARAACRIKINKENNTLIIDDYRDYLDQVKRLIEISENEAEAEETIKTIMQCLEPKGIPNYTLQNSEKESLDDQSMIKTAISWLHLTELWDYLITIEHEQGAD